MTFWPDSSFLLVLLDLFVESVAFSIFLFFLPGHLSLVGDPPTLPSSHTITTITNALTPAPPIHG